MNKYFDRLGMETARLAFDSWENEGGAASASKDNADYNGFIDVDRLRFVYNSFTGVPVLPERLARACVSASASLARLTGIMVENTRLVLIIFLFPSLSIRKLPARHLLSWC
jgi:hypothetical protein